MTLQPTADCKVWSVQELTELVFMDMERILFRCLYALFVIRSCTLTQEIFVLWRFVFSAKSLKPDALHV